MFRLFAAEPRRLACSLLLDLLVAVRFSHSFLHLFVFVHLVSSLLSGLLAVVWASHLEILRVAARPVCLLPLGLFAPLVWSLLRHLFGVMTSDCFGEASV